MDVSVQAAKCMLTAAHDAYALVAQDVLALGEDGVAHCGDDTELVRVVAVVAGELTLGLPGTHRWGVFAVAATENTELGSRFFRALNAAQDAEHAYRVAVEAHLQRIAEGFMPAPRVVRVRW